MAYIGQRPVIGRYIKLDQISSGFNGSNTGFSMTAGSQAVFPGTARNLILSLGGVIQEPDTDFTISGSTLTFTTPPVANTTFFAVIFGDMQSTGTPSDGTVLPASIASSGNFSFPQLTVTGTSSLGDDVTFTGASANIVFDKSDNALEFADNAKATFGTGADMTIKHDGSNSEIINATGSLLIDGQNTLTLRSAGNIIGQVADSETAFQAIANGAVELYYDNSKKLETTSAGATVTGSLTATGFATNGGGVTLNGANHNAAWVRSADTMRFNDNAIAGFGNADDLQIFHNGSQSYLNSTNGPIELRHTVGGANEALAKFNPNGSVELFHDGSKQFGTTSDGVEVQGNITIASANNAPKITFDENGANDPKAEIQMDQESSTSAKLIFKTEGSGTLRDRMTIQSDATVFFRGSHNNTADTEFEFLASTFSPFARFNHTANNAGHTFIQFRSNASQVGEIKDDGDGTCTYDTTSDYRLKENIVNIIDGIERVKKLIPRRFNFKVAPGYTKDGFLAHELQEVVPEAVHGTKDELVTEENKASFPTLSDKKVGDPVYQTADISRVVPLLAAGLKEAIAKIEVLETEVAALKAS